MDEQEDAPPPKRQRFKHLTFNQIVGSIGGDSAKFSRRLMHRSDDSDLFFIEALTKWNDQSFGADYTSFVDSLPCDELNTHAQLLHHKKTILDLLLKSLQNPGCKSIPAFCELLSALVCDLKEDFTENMWDFFGALTNVLDLGERDIESVEAAFYALSLLVKVMWRQLLKEFSQSFVRFIPLFGSSRPYVRRFAAEAFSFIMRKSSNLKKLCCHVVEQAFKVRDDHLSEGCAELFFHICKGVAGGFHSAASEQVECIISGVFSLPNQDVRDYGVTILEQIVQLIVQYVQKGTKADLLFLEIILINFFESSDSMTLVNYSSRLLRLCFVQRRWKNLFSSEKRLLSAIEKVIAVDFFELCFEFIDFVLHCALHVFTGDEWGSALGVVCSRIVSAKGDRSVVFHLLNNMFDVVYFDKHILPVVGKLSERIFTEETSLIPNILKLYSLICLSRRPILEAISRRRSPFLDSPCHLSLQKYVLEQIDHLKDSERHAVACILAVWPWVSADVTKECVDNVVNYIKTLISAKEFSLEISQLALIAVSSVYQMDKNQLKNLECSIVEQFLRNMKCCESSLRVYRFYLESDSTQRQSSSLKRTAELLLPCYYNPNASIRRCALEILCSFEIEVEGMEGGEGKGAVFIEENIFNILLTAECCDIIDFRSRLLQFRKINFGSHKKFLPRCSDTSYDHVILRIGLAQFFVQFTKMWPAMYELLESFARGMSIDDFWAVMSEVIDQINAGCREQNDSSSPILFLEWCDNNNRFDYHSARIQVFKFMGNIWDLAQRRTRILSPILLKIYESDYLPFIVESMSSCGSRSSNICGKADAESEAIEESMATKSDEKMKITKALCAILDVYSKFTDAKSIYMETKIREMYDHLLIVGNDMVQKSVIACIFSYKDKALLPYKENFERLLDEKSFREQLVLFSINEEEGNSVVHSDHRPAVMRVLLRFLYGKLWAQTKRNLIESRRAAIFRYLGGCRPDELLDFLKILFAPILDVIGTTDLDYYKMELLCNDKEMLFNMDFAKVNRCLSSVSNLLVRIARVIVEEQRTMLFRLLLATAVVIKAAIVHPETPNYLSRKLRDLRMSLTDRVGEFLAAYPQRLFSGDEVRGILSYIVVPYLADARSSRDEPIIVAPLSVIKMLAAVCAYPSHYHLLALRYVRNEHSGALMELLVSPLSWAGMTPHMLNIIRKALLNLLTLADEHMNYTDLEYEDIPVQKGRNYGTSLVVAHIQPIIQFLADAVDSSVKKFNQINLELLSKLSVYTPDGALARKMASTIIGHLERKLPKEPTLKKLLDVVASLMRNVVGSEEFLRRIGPLFSKVEGRACREPLVRIVEGLASNLEVAEDVAALLRIVSDLESWDRSRVDEADQDRRHGAYAKLNDVWSGDEIVNLDVLRIFVHAHFHTYSTIKDISLRTSAAANLRYLIDYFARSGHEENVKATLLSSDIIHVISLGLRSQVEVVREESIRCLTSLVDRFTEHNHLKQFAQLRNQDEDLDFFSNIVHIQHHRRQRAVHRLVEQLNSGKVTISFDVLNKYLIPIAHPYLVSTDSKLSALSDECLRLLKYTMSISTWSKYVSCLDSWLKHLSMQEENQKATIRIIVAVVDAFHFEVADFREVLDQEGTNELRISVRDKLNKEILPRLTKCINGKSAELGVHRKARTAATKHYSEDDDIQRAPVALATVKLLQKVPDSMRSQYLHGVVLKLCSLMISRSMNVRETARRVTVQVCECLGPRYLAVIIKEMKLIMNKGFQVHVMIYTVHTLLSAMRDVLKPGDMDACLDDVLDIIVQEQFTAVAEEKEVGEIKAEVSEAKKNPTPGTLLLLGRYVSSSAVGVLLNRFVSVVDSLTSAKMISRARNLLSMFANGLKENQGMTVAQREIMWKVMWFLDEIDGFTGFAPTSQLILIHQMLVKNIEKMKTVSGNQKEAERILEEEHKSCLLLPPEPKRIGVLVKPVLKCRSHIFLEFALQLLGSLITGKNFDRNQPDHVQRLDPFVPLVTQCLEFKYEKVISNALRCLNGMLHMSLPSVQNSLKQISERLFLLLSEYSVLGSAANKESILALNQLLCKSFTQLIVMGDTPFLTDKHVSLLLSYVEIDVLDANRQATAFALIKALVRKKVEHSQIAEVMKKLRELSITSSYPHIRTQCREVLCEFIGNHPCSDDPQKHIEWFIAQLGYELEDGRLSAADMLNSLFSRLQPTVLNSSCFFNVSKIGPMLFNEESLKCRRFITAALNKLLASVSDSSRGDVFSACSDWLELQGEEQEGARAIAVDLLIQISKIEGKGFAPRFRVVLPSLKAILGSESMWTDNSERTISGICYGIASMLQNMGEAAQDMLATEDFCLLFDSLEPLMKCNGSATIRLSAACLIGQCLCSYDPAFFTPERSSQLTAWCCWQLRDKLLSEDVALQASKILMVISRHLIEDQFASLVGRLAHICRFEISHQPNLSLKRSTCFKMAAALVIHEEDSFKVNTTVEHFLPLLVREMNRKSSKDAEELYSISMEVGEVFKNKLGEQKYAAQLAECQKAAVLKTEQRKRKAKELALTNPEEAVQLKRKKNAKKAVARKRKIDVLKPYRVVNRLQAERKQAQHNDDD